MLFCSSLIAKSACPETRAASAGACSVCVHERAEDLGHVLRLLDQKIPPALRLAPLGVCLALLDQSYECLDEGLDTHLRRTGNCHGCLLEQG